MAYEYAGVTLDDGTYCDFDFYEGKRRWLRVSYVYPDERGAVRLRSAVPVSRWASALVDDDSAAASVGAAVTLLRDATAPPDDVDFARGETAAAELGWYAVQELGFL